MHAIMQSSNSSFVDRYGLAEQSFGVARPSQPNYFALFSGSTHGVTDNGGHDLDAPTIADQIEATGRTWGEYAENRPPDCFSGRSAKDGRDGPGVYQRKHAPAISFNSIRTDPDRCGRLRLESSGTCWPSRADRIRHAP